MIKKIVKIKQENHQKEEFNEKNKVVYAGLAADILHQGHINILKHANKLGDVVVGLLTDKAIASYKQLPLLNYNQRESFKKYKICKKSCSPKNS